MYEYLPAVHDNSELTLQLKKGSRTRVAAGNWQHEWLAYAAHTAMRRAQNIKLFSTQKACRSTSHAPYNAGTYPSSGADQAVHAGERRTTNCFAGCHDTAA